MMTIKLAKPVMENEEGMNHLWIQFQCPSSANITDVKITLRLPEGMLRLKNLNGYPENESGTIQIDDPVYERDVLIEIYTQKAVHYEKGEIFITISYKDEQNRMQEDSHSITINLLSDDELNELIMDEEVVKRVKELRDPLSNHETNKTEDEWEFVIIPPKIIVSKELSELEKKYRIDC